MKITTALKNYKVMKFCTCGSMLKAGLCTNKRCKMPHVKDEYASYKQIEYITTLSTDIGDDVEYDFISMTKNEASMIIKSLLEKLEVIEKY